MTKTRLLVDRPVLDEKSIITQYRSSGIKGTNVLVMDEVTGKPIVRKGNKVVVAGSLFTMSKHFDTELPIALPNYNDALGLDNSDKDVNLTYRPDQKVYLFAVSNDGVGSESSQKLDVNYKLWTDPSKLIPFRYVPIGADISTDQREVYFGRKTDTTHISYYFKGFESDPIAYVQYIDGTPADDNLYNSSNTLELQVFEELRLKITKDDLREWMNMYAGPLDSKISSIMLLTAYKKEINGINYYQNIQPLTKLNITAEDMADDTKGLDIIYHIYY